MYIFYLFQCFNFRGPMMAGAHDKLSSARPYPARTCMKQLIPDHAIDVLLHVRVSNAIYRHTNTHTW
jgi:hypothetical protein